jgi:DNA replication protein DnaC
MDNVLLQQLAKKLNLTSSDEEEPYTLTTEEERDIIDNAIKATKDWHIWKMRSLNLPEGEIENKLAMINWDEKIDRPQILQQANSRKIHLEWQKENRRKEKEAELAKQEELKKNWSASRMFRYMEWASFSKYKEQLIVNDDNKALITALCFFVSRDPRFETELKYSFSKGLLVRGNVGIGKTHLMKCLSENDLNPIKILSMLEITQEVRENGEYQIEYGRNKIIYLDDVGTEEPVVNHYGTKITFFKNFIETMYLREADFAKLVISTNNSASEIEEKYGFRVRSRIKDMFNIIDVKGQDMRG